MGKRILIVEDSAMMRKIIAKALTSAGHAIVGEAGSGVEALAMYQQLAPDFVTMDITMQGMNGLTAAKEILAVDAEAKILVLSNLNEEKYGEEAKQIGVLGMINKHKPDDILAFIE